MLLKKQIINSKEAFTLLEMVISMGIFIILFTLILAIYSYMLKAEQRTIQISKLQGEAQLLMEIITKKVRNTRLDYDYVGYSTGITYPEDELALLDKVGNLIVFKLKEGSLNVCSQGDCVNDSDFYSIPPQDIFITGLDFFISPLVNPFSLDNPPTEYPRVTIVMNLQNTQGVSVRNLAIQQTIPQRLGGY